MVLLTMTTTRSPRQRSIPTRMNTWILFAVLVALFSSSDAERSNIPPLAAADGTVSKTQSLRGSNIDAARLLKDAAAPAKYKNSRQTTTTHQNSGSSAATKKLSANRAAKARETKKTAHRAVDEFESESEESVSPSESEESESEVSESEDEDESFDSESEESSENEDVPVEVEEKPLAADTKSKVPDQDAEAIGKETKSIPATKNPKEDPTLNNDDNLTPSDKGTVPATGGIVEETDDETDEIEEELEEELVREKKVARGIGGFGFVFAVCFMIFTAHQMSENPDGIFASVCRLAITITACALKIIFMPCRKLIGTSSPHYNGHMPVSTNDYTYRETPHTNAEFEMS